MSYILKCGFANEEGENVVFRIEKDTLSETMEKYREMASSYFPNVLEIWNIINTTEAPQLSVTTGMAKKVEDWIITHLSSFVDIDVAGPCIVSKINEAVNFIAAKAIVCTDYDLDADIPAETMKRLFTTWMIQQLDED